MVERDFLMFAMFVILTLSTNIEMLLMSLSALRAYVLFIQQKTQSRFLCLPWFPVLVILSHGTS